MANIATNVATDLATNLAQRMVDRVKREAHYLCCFDSFVENFENERGKLSAKQKGVQKDIEDAKKRNENQVRDEVLQWQNEVDGLIQEDTKTRMKCIYGWCPNCIWQHRRGKELARKTMEIKELIDRCNFNSVARPAELPGMKYYSSQDFIDFESRKLVFNNLVDALKNENCYMIGLKGMGGAGKTTLVTEVGKKVEESKIFDKVIFVVVSNTPDFKMIQCDLARQLGLPLGEGKERGYSELLWTRIANNEGKLLIILDDIWGEFDLIKDIGIPSGHNHNGCKVMITTRDSKVCTDMGCQRIIQLSTLTDEDALKLFLKHGNISGDAPSSSYLKAMALDIIKECGGLPVAIVAVARTLRNWPLRDWTEALRTLQNSEPLCGVHEDLTKVYKCLSLSYHNLSEHAKQFFLLCSLFPEDYEIPVELLNIIGIGVGLFSEVENYHAIRSQLLGVKNDLICFSLLLENDEKCVKMHDLVREVALWITKKGIQAVNDSKKALKKNLQYLFWKSDNLPNKSDCAKLEILLLEIDVEGGLEVPEAFFAEMKRLRVLRLVYCRWGRSTLLLSQSLQSLKDIRALILKSWNLGDISVLGNLQSLEALKLEFCTFIELPKEIEELKKLKLLGLTNCRMRRNNPFIVIERCSQLEELYFVGNNLTRELQDGIKNKEVLEKRSPPELQKYYISDMHYQIVGTISRLFISNNLKHLISEAMFKYLVERAEVLGLKEIGETGWKNLIHHIALREDRGINNLIKLSLYYLADIEFLIDTSRHPYSIVTAFSKLIELHLCEVNVQELYRGSVASHFLEQLQILKLKKCTKLHSILFNGHFNLCHLKVVELEDCPMLTSLFQPYSARSLVHLETLIIERCSELKHIIMDESLEEEIVDDKLIELHLNDVNVQELYRGSVASYFLEQLQILKLKKCTKLHSILFNGHFNLCHLKVVELEDCPMLTSLFQPYSARSLVHLETLNIERCSELKHIIMDESLEEEIVDDKDRKSHNPLFPKLRDIEIARCNKLELILLLLFAGDLPLLKGIIIRECAELKYIFGEYQDKNEVVHHNEERIMLPSLESMELSETPSFINIVRESDRAMSSISMQRPLSLSISRDKEEHPYSTSRAFPWSHVCCFLPTAKEANVVSNATLEDHTISPKIHTLKRVQTFFSAECLLRRPLNLQNTRDMELVKCSNLVSLFSLSIATTMFLENLTIRECHNLKHIISNNLAEDHDPINCCSLFPKLEMLKIKNCNKLEILFPSTISGGLQKLKCLHIEDAPELRYVIGNHHHEDCSSNQTKNDELHIDLSAMRTLLLINVPKIISICSLDGQQNLETPKALHSSIGGVPPINTTRLLGQPLKLHNVKVMHFWNFSNLTSLLTLAIASTLTNLETLSIQECPNLKYIIADEEDAQDHVNYHSILPNLKQLEVKDCVALVFLFPAHILGSRIHLKSLNISNAPEFKCVLGNQNIDHLHFDLPALERLHLEGVPNHVSICRHQRQQDSATTKLDLLASNIRMQNLTTLEVINLEIEEIFNLEGLETEGPVVSSLKFLALRNLSELRQMCKDPKYILSLHNLEMLEISTCKKLTAILSASTLRSLPQLRWLEISDCEELVHIIEEDYEESNICYDDSDQPSFPNLKKVVIRCCNSLKWLFSISTYDVFPQLENLTIEDACELEQVFIRRQGDAQKMVRNVLQNLDFITLKKLPRLVTICEGIDFQTVRYYEVSDCPKYQESQAATKNQLSVHSNTDQAMPLNIAQSDLGEANGRQGLAIQELASHSPNSIKEVEVEKSTSKPTLLDQKRKLEETKIITEVPRETQIPFDDDSIEAIAKERVQGDRTIEDAMVANLSADLAPRNTSIGTLITPLQEEFPLVVMKKESRSEAITIHHQNATESVSKGTTSMKAIAATSLVHSQHIGLLSGPSSLDVEEPSMETVANGLTRTLEIQASATSLAELELRRPSLHELDDEQSIREPTSLDLQQEYGGTKNTREAPQKTNIPCNDDSIHAIVKGSVQEGPASNDVMAATLLADSAPRDSSIGTLFTPLQEEFPLTTKEKRDTSVEASLKLEKTSEANLLTYSRGYTTDPSEDNVVLADAIPSIHYQSQIGVVDPSTSMGDIPPILEICEIFQSVELKDGEAALLAKALEQYPQLRLPREQRTKPIIAFSYRVLIDILVMLASKTPITITASDKLTLEANLGAATFFGFDKDWIASVQANVFDIDTSQALAMEEEILVMEAELHACDIALGRLKKKRTKAKEQLAVAKRQLEISQSEFEAIDTQLMGLLEDRKKLVNKKAEFKKVISARDKPFGF